MPRSNPRGCEVPMSNGVLLGNQACDDDVNVILALHGQIEVSMEADDEVALATEGLLREIEAGADLSDSQIDALEALNSELYRVKAIVRLARTPAADRRREWEKRQAEEAEMLEQEVAEQAERQARRDLERSPAYWKAHGTEKRIRAEGYERHLRRSRSKKPREAGRSQERRFVLSQRDESDTSNRDE